MSDIAAERKFVAPARAARRGEAILAHVCRHDSEYPAATVHSLYFDTPHLDGVKEKDSGDFLKRKVRLRWYSVPEHGASAQRVVFLESKRRLGQGRRKLRVRFPPGAEWVEGTGLDDPALREALYAAWTDQGDPLPADLLPVIHLSYVRARYVCPCTGARVCIDTDIAAQRWNERLVPGGHGGPLDAAVFEIKTRGTTELPWLDMLFAAGFRFRSFSKYGACVHHVLQGGVPV